VLEAMGGASGGNVDGRTEWWHPLVLGGAAGSMAEMTVMPMIVVRTRLMVQG
jgi:hypothetical protein